MQISTRNDPFYERKKKEKKCCMIDAQLFRSIVLYQSILFLVWIIDSQFIFEEKSMSEIHMCIFE